MCAGVRGCALVCTGVCGLRDVSTSASGIRWCALVCAGMHWCVWVKDVITSASGIRWCALVCAVCGCKLLCSCVAKRILVIFFLPLSLQKLLPMRFLAALWDQGERDEKTTNTTFYSVEFPKMIEGWRAAFETPGLPFVYVEICSENGAEEPKELDFWQYGQRAALKLPAVGFATTTDIDKSALHPPDKQDIAPRLAGEIRRLALGQNVVARGPELVSTAFAAGRLDITFSNASLVVHAGVVVPPPAQGCASGEYGWAYSPAVTQIVEHRHVQVPFVISGDTVTVTCTPGTATTPVIINGDPATCFLYSGQSGLPAPPLSISCSA